jgi:thiol-disulfide isomerase/thioredoxin
MIIYFIFAENFLIMKPNVRPILVIAMMFISALASLAQEINKSIIDPKLNEKILIGYCNRAGLEEGDFGKSYKEYYSVYMPDKSTVTQLRKRLENVEIIIVLGTWCSDSEEQVPKFLKVLDKIHFDDGDLTMICVDKDKLAGDVDISKYGIQKVPTFIIFRNDNEIGRIVESPMNSLEGDLLMILED